MDFALEDFLKFSKVVMTDTTIDRKYTDLNYSKDKTYLEQVFQLEAVACKDWLTNKTVVWVVK
jgi:phosphoribosylformylglycinamidine synthase